MATENHLFVDSMFNNRIGCMRSGSLMNRPRPNFLEVDNDSVLRRYSMPNPFKLSLSSGDIRSSSDNKENRDSSIRRVRSFKKTNKGVVSKYDYVKNGSVAWSGCTITCDDTSSQTSPQRILYCPPINRTRTPSTTSQDSSANVSHASSAAPSFYRVLLLGSSGVGKKVLVKQFLSSENLEVFDNSSETDLTVSVMLDEEESLIGFLEHPDDAFPEEDINIDAYVVVYSITDRGTFSTAVKLLHHLRNDIATDRPVILVANKLDLVRNKMVTKDEGRRVASAYHCKYKEISASLNHNVDELLVGILSQIRLKLNPEHIVRQAAITENRKSKERLCDNKKSSLNSCKSVIKRLLQRQKSLSCDNLYEL